MNLFYQYRFLLGLFELGCMYNVVCLYIIGYLMLKIRQVKSTSTHHKFYKEYNLQTYCIVLLEEVIFMDNL